MALQFGSVARTNEAAAFQTTMGSTAGSLIIYSGTMPTAADTALSGNVALVTMTLPTSAFTSASGVATQAGTWSGTASATGTATFFRIISAASGTPVVVQGNCTTDLVLQNTSIATGQVVTVSSFTITEGNT